MDKNFEQVICLIRNGKEGELVVNGKSFNKPMPGVATLTDLEIAEVATYIFNTWKHERGLVEVQEASRILAVCDSVSASNNRLKVSSNQVGNTHKSHTNRSPSTDYQNQLQILQ